MGWVETTTTYCVGGKKGAGSVFEVSPAARQKNAAPSRPPPRLVPVPPAAMLHLANLCLRCDGCRGGRGRVRADEHARPRVSTHGMPFRSASATPQKSQPRARHRRRRRLAHTTACLTCCADAVASAARARARASFVMGGGRAKKKGRSKTARGEAGARAAGLSSSRCEVERRVPWCESGVGCLKKKKE